MPIPADDRDAERERVLRIGIRLSAAQQLVEANWTLDQLECRWQLNDWADHPKFVQDVKAVVVAHCEVTWPKQKPQCHEDTEVSNASAVTEAA